MSNLNSGERQLTSQLRSAVLRSEVSFAVLEGTKQIKLRTRAAREAPGHTRVSLARRIPHESDPENSQYLEGVLEIFFFFSFGPDSRPGFPARDSALK